MNFMGMDGEDFDFPEPKTPFQFEETQEEFPEPKEPMMHIDEAGLVSSIQEKYARLMIVRDAHFIQNLNYNCQKWAKDQILMNTQTAL